jgi:hypothetical protein
VALSAGVCRKPRPAAPTGQTQIAPGGTPAHRAEFPPRSVQDRAGQTVIASRSGCMMTCKRAPGGEYGTSGRMPLRAIKGDCNGRARQCLSVSLQGLPTPKRKRCAMGNALGEDPGSAGGRDEGVRTHGRQRIPNQVLFLFCPNCGSTIFAEGDRTPEFCAVPAGCFAGLNLPAPTVSVWEESMHSWLAVASVSEHHQLDRRS